MRERASGAARLRHSGSGGAVRGAGGGPGGQMTVDGGGPGADDGVSRGAGGRALGQMTADPEVLEADPGQMTVDPPAGRQVCHRPLWERCRRNRRGAVPGAGYNWRWEPSWNRRLRGRHLTADMCVCVCACMWLVVSRDACCYSPEVGGAAGCGTEGTCMAQWRRNMARKRSEVARSCRTSAQHSRFIRHWRRMFVVATTTNYELRSTQDQWRTRNIEGGDPSKNFIYSGQ